MIKPFIYIKSILAIASAFIYIKLIFAIASAWIIFLSSPDLWKLSYDISWYIIVAVFVIIGLFVYLYIERELSDIDSSFGGTEKLIRALTFFLLSFVYSLVIGTICTLLISNTIIERTEKDFEKILNENSYDLLKSSAIEYPDTILNCNSENPMYSCCDKTDSLFLGIYRHEYFDAGHNLIKLLVYIDTIQTVIKNSRSRNISIKDNYIFLNSFDSVFLLKVQNREMTNINKENILDSMKTNCYVFGAGNVVIFPRSLILFSILSVFIGIFVQLYNDSNKINDQT